jgi:hypothetical protein
VTRRGHDRRARQRPAHIRTQASEHGPGFDHRRQQSRRDPELREQRHRPVAGPRIHELGGGGVGVFGDPGAGQPVVQQVGHGQHGRRGVDQLGRRLAGRVELVERVEGQELDAGDRIDLVGGDPFEDRVHDPIGADIPVVVRVLDQGAVLAEQGEVAAPGVDAEALDPGDVQTLERPTHLEPEPQDVPLQRPVLPHRLVGKPMDFADVEDIPAQPADDRTTALSTEIEC